MSKNLAASVRTRLKQHADANKQDFNLTLTHYGLERLLYRLSVSEHASNFLLKGALLFTLWYDVAHRATRDATKQKQWKSFVSRNQLAPVELTDVVRRLREKFQTIGIV